MVGAGFNGQAYVSQAHPGVMLKLVTSDLGSAQAVEKEFYASKTAFDMGLLTPQVYEIVRTSYLHNMDNPEILAFFKARITQDLS